MKISFVIPCYRSEKTLSDVVEEIKTTMATIGHEFEIILVNDCSPDKTYEVIKQLVAENKNILGLDLAKNFGQHCALMAGMRHSTGDVVVCLDDDGQTPADEVGKLLDKLDEGYDVCYASYGKKQHSGFRNFGSKVNELMTRIMLGKPKELKVSSYFAAKRFVVDDMLRYEQSYAYVIGLVLRATKNVANVEVNHRARSVGESGYTLAKLFSLWFNGFTAFSIKPLRIATAIGCFCACSGFLYGIYTIVKKFILMNNVQAGFSALMSVLVFIGGMIMLMLGLIGEYIGRIYICMNNSPQYVIREKVGKLSEEE
ncbi:MAG: glycosyltransferase family 2 protein [Lachnospiraceae bacterium]|nr:glycosyltransferase family 2 protein [Lachnospiraceae bacterium]MBR4413364.1 glycosyltransferase family 2 protein [Lachnospiraceae bacterium]MBR5067275.1 glycosyltransferase family 2 protein [Lachnospiraceae bacterium]MBR5916888.1 glycosyltransferase family 2 protein [Lachnospiraceae bacterium]